MLSVASEYIESRNLPVTLESYGKDLQTLLDKKLAVYEEGSLRLTSYGMRYGNRAFEVFI